MLTFIHYLLFVYVFEYPQDDTAAFIYCVLLIGGACILFNVDIILFGLAMKAIFEFVKAIIIISICFIILLIVFLLARKSNERKQCEPIDELNT